MNTPRTNLSYFGPRKTKLQVRAFSRISMSPQRIGQIASSLGVHPDPRDLRAELDHDLTRYVEDLDTELTLVRGGQLSLGKLSGCMPTLDGIAATQRIRKHPRTRQIPVILLTDHPQRAIERGALESGVDVFLTKPCLAPRIWRPTYGACCHRLRSAHADKSSGVPSSTVAYCSLITLSPPIRMPKTRGFTARAAADPACRVARRRAG